MMPFKQSKQVAFNLCCLLVLGCSGGSPEQGKPTTQISKTGKHEMPNEIQLVDEYLSKWDAFAQGDNSLRDYIRDKQASFEAAVTNLLLAKDKRAPSRVVFYAVVQVGGFIPTESPLGKGVVHCLGKDVPVASMKDGSQFFAGDLYFWWQDHGKEYESYSLFEEWCKREFAQRVAIPMYKSAAKKK